MSERLTHVLWLIEKMPTLQLESYWRLRPQERPEAVEKWREAFEASELQLDVAANAAWSIGTHEGVVEQMLREGAQRAPGVVAWRIALANLFEYHSESTVISPALAQKISGPLLDAFFLTDSPDEKLNLVFRIRHSMKAMAGLDSHRLISLAHAEERRVARFSTDSASVSHAAGIISGLFSLMREDPQSARVFLLAARPVPDQLATPNLSLAGEFLMRGECDPVVTYLIACSRCGQLFEEKAKIWIKAIEDNERPALAW